MFKNPLGHNNFVSTPMEQSFDCPHTCDNNKILVQPYIKGCSRPFLEKLNMPPDKRHHLLAIGLDALETTVARGMAAFFFSFRHFSKPGQPQVVPANPEAKNVWTNEHFKTGFHKVRIDKPIAIRFPGKNEEQWPFLFYIHGFCPKNVQDFEKPLTFENCESNTRKSLVWPTGKPILKMIKKVDTLSVCISAERALDFKCRKYISDLLQKLAIRITDGNMQLPNLVVTLTDHDNLFSCMGRSETGIQMFRDIDAAHHQKILEGYIRYSCGLDEMLKPILELPWRNVYYSMCGSQFGDEISVLGMSSWMKSFLDKNGIDFS